MTREELLDWIKESFDAEAEYLWAAHPTFAVFRTPKEKWFGIVMDIPAGKLTGRLPDGVTPEDMVSVLNVKAAPDDVALLQQSPGVYPAYHMNKTHWISLLLDSNIDAGFVKSLIAQSYDLALGKR